MNFFRRIWCWFGSHDHPWVMDPSDAEDYAAGNYRPNIAPPSHCSNCGCTSH